MADVKKLAPFILQWEGGFVNDPDDLGGSTNKGVTIGAFKPYFESKYGREATIQDLRNISEEDWTAILKGLYWDRWKADDIKSQSLANILVDWVWASGVHGIKRPQRILGVAPDGLVGPKTIETLNASDPRGLFDKIKTDRVKFIDEICEARPRNEKYRKGWLNRINSLRYA